MPSTLKKKKKKWVVPKGWPDPPLEACHATPFSFLFFFFFLLIFFKYIYILVLIFLLINLNQIFYYVFYQLRAFLSFNQNKRPKSAYSVHVNRYD